NWRQYFQSLEQMALKFLLNKEITELLKGLSGTGFGKALGLDKLFGDKAIAAAMQVAATTQATAAAVMQTAATTQLAAANAMAAGGGGSGSTGSGILSALAGAII